MPHRLRSRRHGAPVSHSPIQLAAMLATLRAARTPEAQRAATGAVFTAVLPSFTRTCAKLLRDTRLPTYKTAQDLAVDTLTDALPALQRGACPALHHGGLLRWLSTSAHRRLIDGLRSRCGIDDSELAAVLQALYERNSDGRFSGDDHDELRAFYNAYLNAVAELPKHQRAAWHLVVEQELTPHAAAAALQIHRTTVWRNVEAARSCLGTRLAPFAR